MGKHLVLIADSSNARILEKDGAKLELKSPIYEKDKLVADVDKQASKQGRISVENGTFNFAAHSDVRRVEKAEFIRAVVKHLNNGNADMESLILIAPPQTLGELRRQLSHNVLAKVVHEIAKDLTKLREDELLGYVSKPYS